MSDRWYRSGFDPREYVGAPFMATIDKAKVSVATQLMTQPKPVTRFQEVEEALFSKDLPVMSSLAVAKALQYDFDRRGSEIDNRDLISACAQLDDVVGDIRGGDHIVSLCGERIIACLGGYSIQGSSRPAAVTLEMFDASVSGKSASLKRVMRTGEPFRVPVWNVDSIWPYER
jgi:hypothetical protein